MIRMTLILSQYPTGNGAHKILVIAGKFVYMFTPQFSIGAEYRKLRTSYLLSQMRTANHFDLGAAYTF